MRGKRRRRRGGEEKEEEEEFTKPCSRDCGHCNSVFTPFLVYRKTLKKEMIHLALYFRSV